MLFAAACSSSTSQAESVLATQDTPTSVPATPVATTAAVVDTPRPLPTAIALRDGQGIIVTPTPEGGIPEEPADEADDASSDGATASDATANDDGELTYNEAVAIPTQTYNEAVALPTATPVPQATTAPQPTSPPANQTPTPVPQPTADSSNQEINITNGGEVYTLNCARCHGANGLGDLGYRGVLGSGAKFGFAGLVEELTNGHPFTFGFGDKLSAQEINDVVAYVTATFG